jgi:hypothetical protein
VHQLPARPCTIVVADWRRITAFSLAKAKAASLALLHDAVAWCCRGDGDDCVGVVVVDGDDGSGGGGGGDLASDLVLQSVGLVVVDVQQVQECQFALSARGVRGGATSFLFEVIDDGFFLRAEHTTPQ